MIVNSMIFTIFLLELLASTKYYKMLASLLTSKNSETPQIARFSIL